MQKKFDQNGYCVLPAVFSVAELEAVRPVLDAFHLAWLQDNQAFYRQRAINSANLTSPRYLSTEQRLCLFQFISSHRLTQVVAPLLNGQPCFMNSQLFFNPYQKTQKNYWHRDTQYHMTPEQQKAALNGPEVIHVRIAFAGESGIELVPKSHKQWDTGEQLAVRLELQGNKNSQPLTAGLSIPLNAGDVLVFSANMIHRGLYGKNRFALDLLFCESDASFAGFIQEDCLPEADSLGQFENSIAFENACRLKSQLSVRSR